MQTDYDYVQQYRQQGFAVLRGVFDPREIGELAAAFDRVYAQAVALRGSFRHQNLCIRIGADPALGKVVRLVQWPSYCDPTLARFRVDGRMQQILEPLLGTDIKQIINQMHWKPPGAHNVEFGYHQDIRSRRPRSAYRNPGRSYVQTGIAVDPHTESNGAMSLLPGSHLLGELRSACNEAVMDRRMTDGDLLAWGIDPASKVELHLQPGDVALWHLNLVHGSGPNRSHGDRRFYINGYVIADACDRGEWAFRGGQPCELGDPVLVHYEDLYTRPEPHYID